MFHLNFLKNKFIFELNSEYSGDAWADHFEVRSLFGSYFDAKFLWAVYQQRHAGVWGSFPVFRYLSAFSFTFHSSFLFLSFACALAPSAICFICSISIWYLCITLALLVSSSLCASYKQLVVSIACINLWKVESWLVLEQTSAVSNLRLAFFFFSSSHSRIVELSFSYLSIT